MVRSICCVVVLLAAGVASSAPPTETISASHPPRIRFLSLAEARAIALEHGTIGQRALLSPAMGLDSLIQTSQRSGSFRVLANGTPGAEGILVTGIHSNTSRDELERNVNQMLLNVEVAYWNLYSSYWQLHSREQGLRFAYEAWKIVGAKYKVGRVSLADFAQAEGQYNLFRSQRLQALDTVLDNERQLWAILGMPIGEGVRLVPSDAPTLVEKKPDWDKALAETLENRPELHISREDLKVAQLNLLVTKNVLLPVLWLLNMEGPGSADGTMNASRQLASKVNYWLIPSRRIDFQPDDPSCVRQAKAQLARAYLVLQDQELKAERFLGLYYRRMSSSYAQIKAARAQREAFATQLRVRYEKYRAGAQDATLDLLLEAQRFWADALATECQATVTYNNAIAGWAYAKGAIMDHARVTLVEKSPSGCDKVRAAVREHKRTRMQVHREPAVPANSVLCVSAPSSLPALWKSFPPLMDANAAPVIENVSNQKAGRADVRLMDWEMSDIFPKKRGHAKRAP